MTTQLARGWKLLPITLGPQASCQPRFPRYERRRGSTRCRARRRYADPRSRARRGHQGRRVGHGAGHRAGQHPLVRPRGLRPHQHRVPRVGAGLPQRVDPADQGARLRLRRLLQRGSGIKMLDDARVNRPTAFVLPDQIWMARWDGGANTRRRTSAPTGGSRTRGSSSTRAGTTRPGAASRSTSTATTSTSAAARSPRRRPTAAASPSASPATPRSAAGRQRGAARRQVKALQCLLQEQASTPGVTGSSTPRPQGRQRLAGAPQAPGAAGWTRATGCRSSPPATPRC